MSPRPQLKLGSAADPKPIWRALCAAGAFSMLSSLAQLTWRMQRRPDAIRYDAMRYETKRPFRLVKYWLLVFENAFQIEIGNGYGAWDSWTTDGLRLITLSWGLDRSDWRLPPIIICICMRESMIVARSYDRETIYRSIDHGTHNCRSLKENMRYLMYMMESA